MTLGVQYQLGKLVYGFEAYPDAPRLRTITVDEKGVKSLLTHGQDFDYAISAIPVDGMTTILSLPAKNSSPRLRDWRLRCSSKRAG